jgi:signal peptidase I
LSSNYGDHAEKPRNEFARTAASIVVTVGAVVIISWALRTFVVQNYEIPSGSMETTIMTGDMIFSEKVGYNFNEPQAGDIITFIDPENSSRTLIKRIIATGGQTVDLIEGQVYVDGVALDEPYTNDLPSYPLSNAPGTTISYPYTVPEGEVWVMGDNRTNSQDSRYFGSVSVDSITGHAVFRYWPLTSIGPLE